ncbi:MAG TPA: T9SS type A sorting domain-containing protein, partial [Candidatus Cloacimonadota bacterium]|nr:T9SS type A sorting domain-containing protein [Candidatus Cloacimonadota bacterium]
MKHILLLVILCTTTFFIFAAPVWDTPTQVRKGGEIEWLGSSADTPDGKIIYVWSDISSGTRDIYAQKFTLQGSPVWQQPVVISNRSGSQEQPRIIRTTSETYVICWNDYSTNFSENDYSLLCANAINESGSRLWGQEGITICSNQKYKNNIQLIAGSEGSCYFIWEDTRGGEYYAYGQLVNSLGTTQWQDDGIALSPMPTVNSIAINDSGGGFLLGYKNRIDDTQLISVIRYNNTGVSIQETNVFSQQGTNDIKLESFVKYDNNSFICTWQYIEGSSYNVASQKIGNDGAPLWQAPTALFITNDFSDLNEVKCEITSDNKIAISWAIEQLYTDAHLIHIQLLSSEGVPLWGSMWIDQGIGNKGDHAYSLTHDQNGGICILWQDTSFPNNIVAQHIDSAGSGLWGNTGMIVSNHSDYNKPLKASQSNNLICFTWQDQCNGEQGISTQLYNIDGTAQLEANGKNVIMEICGDIIYASPKIIHRSNDTILIWNDGRFSEPQQLYYQIVNDDGICLLEENGRKLIADYNAYATNFSITLGDNDQVAIAWNHSVGDTHKIYAQLIDADGNTLWGEQGLQVSGSDYSFQTNPYISYDNGAFYVGWSKLIQQDHRIAAACQKIVNGQKQWGENGVFITNPNIMNVYNSVIGISGRYLVIKQSEGNSSLLKAQMISPEGIPEAGWPEYGRRIDDYPNSFNDESDPIIQSNDQGMFISWFASREQGKLFAQKISPQGQLLWDSNGLLISDSALMHNQTMDDWGITYLWSLDGSPEKLMYSKYNFDSTPMIADTTVINTTNTNVTFEDFQVCGFLNGGQLVAMNHIEDEIAHITYQYVDQFGSQVGHPAGTLLSNPVNYASNLAVTSDQNNAYIAWNEYAFKRSDPYHNTIWNNDKVGLFLQKLSNDTVGTHDPNAAATMFSLSQNYPNPFNPETTIRYSLPANGQVRMEIYNIKGQKVRTLLNDWQTAGNHEITWYGTDNHDKSVSSGVYFYRLTTGN